MSRHQPIYTAAVVRTARGGGRRRHLFRAQGIGFPTSLCADAQGTPTAADDVAVPWCPECRLVAVTELALALTGIGLNHAAVAVGSAVRDISFETAAAQSA